MKRDLQFGILVAIVTGVVAFPSLQSRSSKKPSEPASAVSKNEAPAIVKTQSASEGPVVVSPAIPKLETKKGVEEKSALTDVVPDGFILPEMKSAPPVATKLSLPGEPNANKTEEPKPVLEKPQLAKSEPVKEKSSAALPILPGADNDKKSDKKLATNEEPAEKKPAALDKKEELPLPPKKELKKEFAEATAKDDSQDRNAGEALLRQNSPAKRKDDARPVVVQSYEITKDDSPNKKASLDEFEPGKAPKKATAKTSKGPAHPYFQRYLDDGEYFIREGDTLEAIAFRLYRDESRAQDIARANPKVDADRPLKPGLKLKVPPK